MSLPSTPSPAAHHFARLCQRSGRRTGGHLVHFWAMSSPPPRHHIASEQQPANSRAAPRRSAILPASSSFPSNPSGGEEGKSKGANRTGRERTRAKDAADIFARSSLLSVAITVHALARSSLPSSSAVPVILCHDLVRSLSSVRPSVFLFLVPRSPSFRLTAKSTPASHYLIRSKPR